VIVVDLQSFEKNKQTWGSPRVIGYSRAYSSMLQHLVNEERVLGIEVPSLGYIPRAGLCYDVGFLGSFCQRSRAAHYLHNHGCIRSPSWLPNHAKWANTMDEWDMSPPAVSGVPCGPGDKKAGRLALRA
jgi:hypothetical protein